MKNPNCYHKGHIKFHKHNYNTGVTALATKLIAKRAVLPRDDVNVGKRPWYKKFSCRKVIGKSVKNILDEAFRGLFRNQSNIYDEAFLRK